MNRYEAEGIARDAAAGKSIFILANTQHVAEHELDSVHVEMPDSISHQISRHNRQSIEFKSGGFIRLLTLRTPGRLEGLRADVIYSSVDFRYLIESGLGREIEYFDNFLRFTRHAQTEFVSRY